MSIPHCPAPRLRGIKPRTIFSLLFNLTESGLNFSLKLYFHPGWKGYSRNLVVCCKEKSKRPHGIFSPVVSPVTREHIK